MWARIAGTSEATKYSLSPSPMTTGRAGARGHDLVRFGAGDHRQGEDARQLLHGGPHGLLQIALEVLLDQVGDHLGIGFGLELVALVLELLLEAEIVFDDAVVDDDDVALAVAVRMRVFFGGAAMGGPTRVADAEHAIERVELNRLFEVAQLAFGAADVELVVSAIHGQTGRVIPPILQPLEAFQNDRNGALRPDVPYDSAHRDIIGLRGAGPRPTCTGGYRSVEELDAEILDDGVGKNVARDGLDVLVGLLPRDAVGERDIEELALPHGRDGGIAETVERRANGLALRVQHSGLQRNEDASFHGNLDFLMKRTGTCSSQDDDSRRERPAADRRVRLRRRRPHHSRSPAAAHAAPELSSMSGTRRARPTGASLPRWCSRSRERSWNSFAD